MSAARFVTVAAAVVLAAYAVAAASLGIPAIVDFVADPEGFLAGVAAMLGGFLVVAGVAAAVTAWGVLREAPWAWQAAILATAVMLLTGAGGLSGARQAGGLPLAEVALSFGGVMLAALLAARWVLRRQDGGRTP